MVRTKTPNRRRAPAHPPAPALFLDPPARNSYDLHFHNRNPVICKCIDFDQFTYGNLTTLFRNMGWENFMSHNRTIYPDLLRYFYANLRVESAPDASYSLRSLIRGHHVVITAELINEVLELDNAMNALPRVYGTNKVIENFGPSKAEQFTLIFGSPNLPKPKLKDNRVLPQHNVLHNIVSFMLCQRDGHRRDPSYLDVWVMSAILTGYRFNLGFFILKHIGAGITKPSTRSFVFGHVITSVLAHLGVDLRPFADNKLRMGKECAYTDAWVNSFRIAPREGAPAPGNDHDEDNDAPEGGEEIPPPPPQPHFEVGSSSGTREITMDDIYARLTTFQSSVDANLAQLNNRMTHLESLWQSQFSAPPPPPPQSDD